MNGKVSFGHLAAGYLGLLLLGSADAGDRDVRLGAGADPGAGRDLLGLHRDRADRLLACWRKVTEHPFNDVFVALALHGRHFPPFQAGAIHLRDVVYYLMVTYVALFAATRVMEARRWR